MKKIITIAFFLCFVAATNTFAQTEALDCTNDFKEVKAAFQKRVRNASTEFKYFLHAEESFDFEDIAESDLLDKKSKKKIQEYNYFILEDSGGGVFFIMLIKKEEEEAVIFMFIDEDGLEGIGVVKCSNDEINKALALYQ
jgi:hypothetical protein